MTADRELMRLHVATLFTSDDRNRLVLLNVPEGGPAPRFFLGRTRESREWWVRADVGDEVAEELGALCMTGAPAVDDLQPLATTAEFEAILGRSAPVWKIWSGPVFYAGEHVRPLPGAVAVTPDNVEILRAHLPDWIDSAPNEFPMMVAVLDGDAVAVCSTVRRAPGAVQAGVETAPDFRGRGYATIAVAAWADAVLRSGLVPLYSTSWQNVASRALARRLGLTLFGADLHLT